MNSLAAAVLTACIAAAVPDERPVDVAVIIDDIGYDYSNSLAAVEIEKPFAYAVLPFSPHAEALAHLANRLGKGVLVHLPMEADSQNHALGPGALRLEMSRHEIESTLSDSIAAVPFAIGINNHMGSRLTREAQPMLWLMQAIRERGALFFIDSRTTASSVALISARRAAVDALPRDVFIDNVKTRAGIERQLARLAETARQQGYALGIAHPHPVTIDVLGAWDPAAAGVRLLGIADFVAAHKDAPAVAGGDHVSAMPSTECGDDRDDAETTEYPYAQR